MIDFTSQKYLPWNRKKKKERKKENLQKDCIRILGGRGNRDRTRKTFDKKIGKIYKFRNSKISNIKQDESEGNQQRLTIIRHLKTKDKKKRTWRQIKEIMLYIKKENYKCLITNVSPEPRRSVDSGKHL